MISMPGTVLTREDVGWYRMLVLEREGPVVLCEVDFGFGIADEYLLTLGYEESPLRVNDEITGKIQSVMMGDVSHNLLILPRLGVQPSLHIYEILVTDNDDESTITVDFLLAPGKRFRRKYDRFHIDIAELHGDGCEVKAFTKQHLVGSRHFARSRCNSVGKGERYLIDIYTASGSFNGLDLTLSHL